MTTSFPDIETRDQLRREYPAQPLVGVGAVVLDRDMVLLIRRGRAPLQGEWSLPGGLLELGETTAEGATREVWEETGVRVRPVVLVATLDRILRDHTAAVQFHYVLVDWCCVPVEQDRPAPTCGDDALAAEWVALSNLPQYHLAESTVEVIEKARSALAEPS